MYSLDKCFKLQFHLHGFSDMAMKNYDIIYTTYRLNHEILLFKGQLELKKTWKKVYQSWRQNKNSIEIM